MAPPFWAIAWVGGQAIARYLLDHPEEAAGKRVLDLAAGRAYLPRKGLIRLAEYEVPTTRKLE